MLAAQAHYHQNKCHPPNLFENTHLSKRSLNVKTDMKSASNVTKHVLVHWMRNEPQPLNE